MSYDVKQMFSMYDRTPNYNNLNAKEQILVENGVKVVQKFYAAKNESNAKKGFSNAVLNLGSSEGYEELNKKFVSKLVKYCMEFAGESTENFDVRVIANPQINSNPMFRSKFNAVIAQVITPIIPALISAEYNGLADVSNIAYGDTARFLVRSNDSFYVTRIAEGVLRGSVQRIYNDEITMNPEPYNVETAVDWYHIASGVYDFGDFVFRVGLAFANYINLAIIDGVMSHVANGINNNNPYFTNGFTDAKYANLIEIVGAANRSRVYTMGTLPALAAVLPDAARAQMMADFGREWTAVGHLGRYMDTELVRIPQILLPNTVNTTPLLGVPNDLLLVFASGAYNPMKVVFEGAPVYIDIVPTEAPDKEMGISVTSRFATGLVLGSQFGAISGVSLN